MAKLLRPDNGHLLLICENEERDVMPKSCWRILLLNTYVRVQVISQHDKVESSGKNLLLVLAHQATFHHQTEHLYITCRQIIRISSVKITFSNYHENGSRKSWFLQAVLVRKDVSNVVRTLTSERYCFYFIH